MMRTSSLLLFASLAALAGACNSGNPVAPAPPAAPPPSSALNVTVTSSQGSVVAGSTQGVTLTVTAKPAAGGAPPADGTPVNVNTSLGNFGVDAAGKPLQLITRQLAGGTATAIFYAGSQTGTANILAQVGTSTGSLNLPVVATPPPLVADFTFETAGLSVLFTDASVGLPGGVPITFAWDFGDGAASPLENPSHTYAAAGSYTVTFSVAVPTGTASKRKFVTVQPQPGVIADFGFQTSGLSALFTDQSSGSPTSWSWSFGDCGNPGTGGCSSGTRNPSHTYLQPGTYAVSLTASTATSSGSVSKFVTVARQGAPPVADFAFQVTGLTVLFADQSTGNPTRWAWTFGDGSPTDLDQNPSHTYAAAGTYTVTLTASNDAGQSTKTRFVTAATPPQADFAFQASGLAVAFSDRSSGSPTGWSWNFGDCPQNPSCTDTKNANPTHVYSTGGTYTVSLTVTNAAGQSTISKLVTVSAGTPPHASFSYQTNHLTALFTDRSSGNPTGWAWDFGDCPRNPTCTSADQNPTHTYAAGGTYTVTLTVSNSTGSNSVSLIVGVSP